MKKALHPHLRIVPPYQESLNLKVLEGLKARDSVHLATENSTYHLQVVGELAPYLIAQVVGGNNHYLNESGILIMAEREDGHHLVLEKLGKRVSILETSRISGMTVEKSPEEEWGRQVNRARVVLVRLFQKLAQ